MAKVLQRRAAVKKPTKKIALKTVPKKAVVKPVIKIVFRQDVRQTATLVRVGRAGAANAIRASKALGLPITYIEGGAVIQEMPNGVKNVVNTITKARINTPAITLKKGMILHAKK